MAGPSQVLAGDLLSSLDLAWSQDPSLQAALQAHQVNLTRIPQARAALLPSVNLTLQNNASRGSYSFSGTEPSDRPIRSNSQALQLTQPLYRPQLDQAFAQAKWQAEQSLAQLQQAEQDLMLRLIQAYTELQAARNQQDVAAAQLKAQVQQVLVARNGLKAGTHTMPDVYEAQSKHGMAQSQVLEAATQWRIKRQELLKITGEAVAGESAENWPALSDHFALQEWADKTNHLSLDRWMEQARIDSPAVKAQMAAVEVALHEIRKNRAAHLPTLDATASRTLNGSTGNTSSAQNYDSNSRVTQIGLQLTIPIYAGGGTAAKVREAVAAWDKAQFDLETAQRMAESTVVQAFESIDAAKAKIQALQIALDAAQLSIQANAAGVRFGTRTPLDLYNAEQQLATVQRDWRQARYDLLLQTGKLKASAGLLEREDLLAVNAGFQTRAAPVARAQGAMHEQAPEARIQTNSKAAENLPLKSSAMLALPTQARTLLATPSNSSVYP